MTSIERSPHVFQALDHGRKVEWYAETEYEDVTTLLPGGIELKERVGTTVVNEEKVAEVLATKAGRLVVAALFSYHHLTEEQLSVFTGISMRVLSDVLPAMFTAGLLEKGWFAPGDNRISLIENPLVIYRLSDPSIINKALKDNLDFDSLLATVLGREVSRGPQHEVHNLIAAELSARLAEHHQRYLGMILGEPTANQSTLSPEHVSKWARGDFVAFRKDGLKIVFEYTTTSSKRRRADKLAGKLKNWMPVLAADPTVIVVFVLGGDGQDKETGTLLGLLKNSKLDAKFKAQRAGIHSRVYIARMDDWFDDNDEPTARWESLEAIQADGLEAKPKRASVLKHAAVFNDPEAVKFPLERRTLLLSNPAPLREKKASSER